MDHSLVLSKKENYSRIKYKLVKKVLINSMFFLTLLIASQRDKNDNCNMS